SDLAPVDLMRRREKRPELARRQRRRTRTQDAEQVLSCLGSQRQKPLLFRTHSDAILRGAVAKRQAPRRRRETKVHARSARTPGGPAACAAPAGSRSDKKPRPAERIANGRM